MPGPKPIDVVPRTAWHDSLAEAVIEVFATMVGASVSVAKDLPRVPAQMTGMVGIAGAIRANFVLQCSASSSIKIASQMLGVSADDPNAQKAARDALGEVCNIVAGHFKDKVGLGDACQLSVPTIIAGTDYRICSAKTYERLELSLVHEGETLWVTLEIAQ